MKSKILIKSLDKVIKSLLYRFSRRYLLGKFNFWEKQGIHITPVSYDSPIPNLAELREKIDLLDDPVAMVGFDWNENTQIRFVRDVFPLYCQECRFPYSREDRINVWDYFIDNGSFPVGDACLLHNMIKHFRPKRIVEVGCGFSTLVMARAITPPPGISVN